jgi:hypothetical protein
MVAMAANAWTVLDEPQRLQWDYTPFECVGPLRFGMTHGQVQAAVAGSLRSTASVRQGWPGKETWADFWLKAPNRPGSAVTVYYDQRAGLAGVEVDALRGPQVMLDGLRLAGQVPSRLEDQFAGYAAARGEELRYGQHGDPCSPHLGLVLRVQRAGDAVLSRPVFVAEVWSGRCWDVSEGPIPRREWNTF